MPGGICPQQLHEGSGHESVQLLPYTRTGRAAAVAGGTLSLLHEEQYFLYRKPRRKHFRPAGVSQ
jgi:hypothetical protein